MDLEYTPEEQDFRHHVAAWIAANAPAQEKRNDLEELRAWQRRQHGAHPRSALRQRLADLAVKARVTKSFGLRAMSDSLHGRFNPHSSAAMKLFTTELSQRFSETGIDLLGDYGILWEGGGRTPDGGRWSYSYLHDRSMTIAGGTSEVQRNIVAQRVLGLPRGT